MKVIFLDIDGVLNFPGTEARSPGGWIGVSSQQIKLLRDIVKETGAYLVLSSTWRHEWSPDEEQCTEDGKYLNRRLTRYGLHIIDKTIKNHEDLRGEAIREWLSRHPHVDNWIVLDDNSFLDFQKEGILPHLVMTSAVLGLTKHDADECIRKLNHGTKEEDLNA